MTPIYGALAVILTATITGYVSWRIALRAKSGKINTSEAATLWDEGTKMRLELRAQVTTLEERLSEAIAAVTDLNREIKTSRAETERSREETRLSRAETRELMAQLEAVHSEVKTHNALTMGALADNQETRRILDVPKDERTPVEFDHLASAGERQPEGEHPPISDDELRPEDVKDETEPPDE